MNQKKVRGKAESTWTVTRRCLAILLRLQKGAATRTELINASYAESLADMPADEIAVKRFHNDKARMANSWGIKIGYNKQEKAYVIQERHRPLLNLPPAAIETLAFLKHSYQDNVPGAFEVSRLVEQLVDWLPADGQRAYQNQLHQRALATNQALRDNETINPTVEMLIRKAWEERRIVLFEYMARSNESGVSKQHRVQPWELRINKSRRHLELWGYCEWQTTIHGEWKYENYRTYRLGRIVPGSIEIKGKIPGVRPVGKPIRVAYELDPRLLVGGLSSQDELIDEPILVEQADGWWRVEGQTYSVFSLTRELLYYGEKCRVVDAGYDKREDRLQKEMKKIVDELHRIYF
jgi:predicted DNA-binding transcriptional regulator YafY